jgi:hypothetical protein
MKREVKEVATANDDRRQGRLSTVINRQDERRWGQ